MMVRLVKRLPVMLCPKWTLSRTQPIALADVVRAITFALKNQDCFGKSLDIGGPDKLTYIAMMQNTAEVLFGR